MWGLLCASHAHANLICSFICLLPSLGGFLSFLSALFFFFFLLGGGGGTKWYFPQVGTCTSVLTTGFPTRKGYGLSSN